MSLLQLREEGGRPEDRLAFDYSQRLVIIKIFQISVHPQPNPAASGQARSQQVAARGGLPVKHLPRANTPGKSLIMS